MRRTAEAPERFAAMSAPLANGCIEWVGARNGNGYGRFKPGGSVKGMRLAHRWAYEYHVGPIAPDLVIDHLCRNRSCVNPEHLEAVTQGENVRRGHGPASRTHCPQGHPYAGANLYINPRGYRICRNCQRRKAGV